MIVIAVGGGLLLLLLATICICCCCFRCERRTKRKAVVPDTKPAVSFIFCLAAGVLLTLTALLVLQRFASIGLC